MAAHAGEKAQKTGDFHCAKCDEKVHVKQGDKIPKCPNGHSEFETRTKEPGNKS
jgi:ribosomal protein L37AE/L43A